MDAVFEIVGGDGHDGLKQGAPSVHWLRSLVHRMHGTGISVGASGAPGRDATGPDGPFTGEAPGADLRARIAELEAALAPLAEQDCESWGCLHAPDNQTVATCVVARARTVLGEGRPE